MAGAALFKNAAWAIARGSIGVIVAIVIVSIVMWLWEWYSLKKLEAITADAKLQGEPAKQALISLMKNQANDRRSQLFGLTCIIESSLIEEEGRNWGDVGACQVSLLALQHFTTDDAVQLHGLYAVSRLASCSEENRRRLACPSSELNLVLCACQSVPHAMMNFPNNELLQLCGLQAMANLSTRCDNNRRRLLLMGAKELVQAARKQFPKSEPIRKAANNTDNLLVGPGWTHDDVLQLTRMAGMKPSTPTSDTLPQTLTPVHPHPIIPVAGAIKAARQSKHKTQAFSWPLACSFKVQPNPRQTRVHSISGSSSDLNDSKGNRHCTDSTSNPAVSDKMSKQQLGASSSSDSSSNNSIKDKEDIAEKFGLTIQTHNSSPPKSLKIDPNCSNGSSNSSSNSNHNNSNNSSDHTGNRTGAARRSSPPLHIHTTTSMRSSWCPTTPDWSSFLLLGIYQIVTSPTQAAAALFMSRKNTFHDI